MGKKRGDKKKNKKKGPVSGGQSLNPGSEELKEARGYEPPSVDLHFANHDVDDFLLSQAKLLSLKVRHRRTAIERTIADEGFVLSIFLRYCLQDCDDAEYYLVDNPPKINDHSLEEFLASEQAQKPYRQYITALEPIIMFVIARGYQLQNKTQQAVLWYERVAAFGSYQAQLELYEIYEDIKDEQNSIKIQIMLVDNPGFAKANRQEFFTILMTNLFTTRQHTRIQELVERFHPLITLDTLSIICTAHLPNPDDCETPADAVRAITPRAIYWLKTSLSKRFHIKQVPLIVQYLETVFLVVAALESEQLEPSDRESLEQFERQLSTVIRPSDLQRLMDTLLQQEIPAGFEQQAVFVQAKLSCVRSYGILRLKQTPLIGYDTESAKRFLVFAAKEGNLDAMMHLGLLYYYGDKDNQNRDYSAAIKYFTMNLERDPENGMVMVMLASALAFDFFYAVRDAEDEESDRPLDLSVLTRIEQLSSKAKALDMAGKLTGENQEKLRVMLGRSACIAGYYKMKLFADRFTEQELLQTLDSQITYICEQNTVEAYHYLAGIFQEGLPFLPPDYERATRYYRLALALDYTPTLLMRYAISLKCAANSRADEKEAADSKPYDFFYQEALHLETSLPERRKLLALWEDAFSAPAPDKPKRALHPSMFSSAFGNPKADQNDNNIPKLLRSIELEEAEHASSPEVVLPMIIEGLARISIELDRLGTRISRAKKSFPKIVALMAKAVSFEQELTPSLRVQILVQIGNMPFSVEDDAVKPIVQRLITDISVKTLSFHERVKYIYALAKGCLPHDMLHANIGTLLCEETCSPREYASQTTTCLIKLLHATAYIVPQLRSWRSALGNDFASQLIIPLIHILDSRASKPQYQSDFNHIAMARIQQSLCYLYPALEFPEELRALKHLDPLISQYLTIEAEYGIRRSSSCERSIGIYLTTKFRNVKIGTFILSLGRGPDFELAPTVVGELDGKPHEKISTQDIRLGCTAATILRDATYRIHGIEVRKMWTADIKDYWGQKEINAHARMMFIVTPGLMPTGKYRSQPTAGPASPAHFKAPPPAPPPKAPGPDGGGASYASVLTDQSSTSVTNKFV